MLLSRYYKQSAEDFYHQQKLECRQMQGILFYYIVPGHVDVCRVMWIDSKDYHLVLVTTRDDSIWTSLLHKLSTVSDTSSKRAQNFPINFSLWLYRLSTKAIRFFSFLTPWAYYLCQPFVFDKKFWSVIILLK